MLRNPIIGQYVEALTDPFRIFRTLGEVVPERDAYGEPLFWSGNYSVIFKVRCADGKYYALKCYTRLPRHAAEKCDFDIDVFYNRIIIDAKSMLGVLSLDLSRELTVKYGGKNNAFENVLCKYACA